MNRSDIKNASDLAHRIATIAESKKADNVRIFNINALSDITEYFVISSGGSDTQVKAIADAIESGTRELGIKLFREEGMQNMLWVVLDYFDVVVHVFQSKVREYYALERLWADAEIELTSISNITHSE